MKKYTNWFRKLLIINYSLLITICACAQDSSRLRISLLTCTPGEELYSTFGHSAFRVIDSNSVTDIVYNYGTFNFDDEGFYLKFIQGKLNYYLSLEHFEDFKRTYQADNRGITEQVLALDAGQKTRIRAFLNENAKPANRFYLYDFFFDNCTTRLRDILKKEQDSLFGKKPVMPEGTRFRQAIHHYLDKNGQPWSKLGIDILLGLPCDAVMTPEQMQFLPDNLMYSIDSSARPMIISKQDLYPIPQNNGAGSPYTPLIAFSVFAVLIVGLGYLKNNFVKIFLNGFDGMFFFLTGALGILLILMWTATNHAMCKENFNLLWAWPTHIVMAFLISSKKSWVRRYFGITTIGLSAVLLTWFFLPQQMNPALIPIVLLLIYRSYLRWKAI